ncbi:MAG: Natural resistance-associated macrophage protein [Candidatus Daviesbacteria bacterium GW2011_GWA1_41_61]|uniref:Natural resistance-associated macrophage protein n=1 Tax=Candidatus Daviesbacteria bacterium GW2011_GWA2_40_9 TaxID=1618424 RepID=A0A0G0U1A5_9BACT|nr:MAG: Natural resistance-associated macrophage protein [Candidatus Daviesbacteria bacterium GW2011_GWC1_40_9]KKR82893.1 MAG: Natural resistance-associated macrophage protein [Candidatus Daviesbacteria bacterium GW2011_GWA2_40_9]KKR92821.1 MAG: Natural resistance-associated macrophage protein [Candidatus Daviesbacteria bacterium GW2011_GWB1_41_15]KKS15365.1 MAG: Natural resistance-associated macrophage protein [Candidatus Daviesbacteria bacterium GW2011_GWA1_41_61]
MSEKILERVVETPAIALDKTITATKQVTQNIPINKSIKEAREYWHTLGPGLTTGASDDDPSGIATYSQAGAQYGFQLLWLAGFTFPLMSVVQEMCARIGLVTGRGLAANIRLHFPKWVLYLAAFLLFFANSLNIGADLGAMAKATQLLYPQLNFGLLVVGFTVLSLGLQIFTSYEKYAKYLKWLALVLLAYIFSALSVNLDFNQLLKNAVVPSLIFSKEQIFIVTAILGTTISPYLFFWQTSQEVEEQILEGKTTVKLRQEETTNKEVKDMRIDVWSGMFLSNLVMFFIIAACAATLYASGVTNITTAADAAEALKPIAGDQAYLLFALGIIGTGLLAIPVLAGSASYAISESFGWKNGLYRDLKSAYSFYGVIMLSTIIGLAINFVGIDAIKALIYTAVANGLVAPVILVLILLLSNNKKIMGNRSNHPLTTALGWLITVVMVVAGVATIISLFSR